MAKQVKLSAAEERAQFEQNCTELANVFAELEVGKALIEEQKLKATGLSAQIKEYAEAYDKTFFEGKKSQVVNGVKVSKSSTTQLVRNVEAFSQTTFYEAFPTLCKVELSLTAIKAHYAKDEGSRNELRELGVDIVAETEYKTAVA